MKITRPYILIASLFLLLVVGLLFYHWRERQLFSSVWAFIPQDAVLVIESRQPLPTWQQWKEQAPWQTIEALPYFQKLNDRLATLQKAAPEVTDWLQSNPVVSSMHVISPDDFDYVFYLPLSGDKNKALFENILRSFTTDRAYQMDSRNFGGFLIREIMHRPSSTRFSYILHNDIVVGSYTPFLVEDVVRTLNETSSLQPNKWVALQQVYALGKHAPQLYLSAAALPRFAQVFAASHLDSDVRQLAHIAQSFGLTAEATPNNFSLTGKGELTKGEKETDYLSTFAGQEAKPIACLELVPSRTAVLQRWGLSEPMLWGNRLQQYWSQHEPQTLAARQSIEQQYGVSLAPFFDWLGNELVLITPENADNPSERLLIVQVAQQTEAGDFLDNLVQTVNEKEDIAPYKDQINRIPVRQMRLSEFPAALLGSSFKGFPQCFYASVDNYLIFASSLSILRQQLEDMRVGNVWERSRPKFMLPGQLNRKAHFSCFVDIARSWPLLLHSASPHWQQLLKTHKTTLQKFDQFLLETQAISDHQASVHVQLHQAKNATKEQLRNKYFVNHRTPLDTTLQIAPVIVRSHLNATQEILVQDVANRLYLLGGNGKALWRKWMEKPIAGEVYQVDYLKNKKLQYLFTTEHNLYLLDRNGNPVGNFPVRVPASAALQTAAIFDYDGNLNYRFLAQDLVGNLFLYDKEGKLLDNWNPLRLGYRLQGPVRHIRVRDKDYLMAVQLDGKVHLLNRQGKNYDGFPLNLSSTSNPLFIETGTDAQNTFLTALTDQGEIVRFNLLGKIPERQQLYRPSKNTLFRICIDNARRGTWLVMRHDEESVSMLDRKGNPLFTKEAEPGEKYEAQYYDFGAGLQVVALTNLTKARTRLFNLSGELIGDTALGSDFPVSIIYSNHFNKLLIYTGDGRRVKLISVKI